MIGLEYYHRNALVPLKRQTAAVCLHGGWDYLLKHIIRRGEGYSYFVVPVFWLTFTSLSPYLLSEVLFLFFCLPIFGNRMVI